MLGDLGKLIEAKGFKKLPKVHKIARSGHTDDISLWGRFQKRIFKCNFSTLNIAALRFGYN